MGRHGAFGLATLLLALLAGCGSAEPALPVVELVTVVVSTTPGATQTPWIVTTVEQVVVTATPRRSPTPSRTATGRATTTRSTVVAVATATPRPVVASATSPPTVTATATPIPTVSATAVAGRRLPAVTLIRPADGDGFATEPPQLEWVGVDLGPAEFYEVTIEREWQGALYYAGGNWVREPRMVVDDFVRGTSDSGAFTWWVTIKQQTGTDRNGARVGIPLSPPSERRTFFWNP